MQFAMPMAAGYEGFHFTPFQAEKEQAELFVGATRAEPAEDEAFVRVRAKTEAEAEAAILKAKAEAEKVAAIFKARAEKEPKADVEEEAFVVKAKEEKEEAFVVKAKSKANDPAFMALAGQRGPGMAEADEMDYMSDETDYGSDEDIDVTYAKMCERFELRRRVRHAHMPWLKFQSAASLLKMQEDNKGRQEEVSVVV